MLLVASWWPLARTGIAQDAPAQSATAISTAEHLSKPPLPAPIAEAPAAPLPLDPSITTGTLGNGVSWMVDVHPAPDGTPARLALGLFIHAGTTDERDEEVGAARIWSRLACLGTTAHPGGPADMVAAFDGTGVRPADDLKSDASFEHCLLTIGVPAADDGTIRAVLEYFAGVVGGVAIDDARVARAIGQLSISDRAQGNWAIRANATLLPLLMPASLTAKRLPYAPFDAEHPPTIEALRAYVSRVIGTRRTTVIAVGEIDPARAAQLINATFGKLPATGQAAPAKRSDDVRLPEPRAAWVSDPAMTMDFAQLSTTQDGGRALRTTEDLRRELAAKIAFDALKRSLDRDLAAALPGTFTRGLTEPLLPAVRLNALVASGKPGAAMNLAGRLASAVHRLQARGLSEQETRAAADAVLIEQRRSARDDATLSPDALLLRRAQALMMGDAPLSSAQRAELAAALLPQITPAEATAELRARLDLSHAAIIALTPPTAEKNEAKLLEALRTAATAPMPAPAGPSVGLGAEAAEPRQLTEGSDRPAPPHAAPPGTVSRMEIHPASGVVSAWLNDGVRFHHRKMAASSSSAPGTGSGTGQVQVALTLSTGTICETRETRGLTGMLIAFCRTPATSAMSIDRLQRAMGDLTIETDVEPDAFTIVLNADARELEHALRLARLLLTEPKFEQAPYERRKTYIAWIAGQTAVSPDMAITNTYIEALYPRDDPRFGMLTAAEIGERTYDQAREFVEHTLTTAPLEVAIVGDIDRAAALSLAARYLGTLPQRERPDASLFASERTIAFADGPVSRTNPLGGPDARAVVLEGFRGCDATDTARVVGLDIAAEVLSARLTPLVRDRLSLAPAVTLMNRPSDAYSGAGEFWAAAQCAPEQVAELRTVLRKGLDELASQPATRDEVLSASKRISAEYAQKLGEPRRWAVFLSRLTGRGWDSGGERTEAPGRMIDSWLSEPRRAADATPETVLAAVRSISADSRRVSACVSSSPGAPARVP